MAHSPLRQLSAGPLVLAVFASLPAAAGAQSTAAVSGLVRSDQGEPIENATVRAEQPGVTSATFGDTSDEHGRFSMIGLSRGTWTFIAEAEGYVPQERRLSIRTLGSNPLLLFTLSEGVVEAETEELNDDEIRQVQTDLAEADRLRADGQPAEAVAVYRDILARMPSLSAVHFEIGRTERERGAFGSALEAFEQILATDPENQRVQLEIGVTELMGGELAAARAILEPLAADPDADREVCYYLGEAAFRLQEMETAGTWYRRAAAADSSWTPPLLKLGLIALTTGNTDQAAIHLRRVVEIAPGSADAEQAEAMLQQIGSASLPSLPQ